MKKQKKKDNLIFVYIGSGFLLLAALIGVIFLLVKRDSREINPETGLGQQQNQQTQNAVLQLASNLLGNTNNLNQLTRKPNGGVRTIQEIEEEFLISAFQSGQSPVGGVGSGLPPEVIERIWWELSPWIEEYLQDLNQSILDHAREKFRRDVENWLKWQQREYNRQLEKYQKRLQKLQSIEDLIQEYQKIREQELLDKISRKTELRNKGYVDRDIEKLREWNLITPEQEIPDLTAEKRIGATNILYTSGEEPNRIGGSCDLIIFLKSGSSQEININFTIDLGEYKNYYEQIIRNFLTKGQKVCHKYPQWDAYENVDFSPLYKEKVKQIHFTRSTSQIEIALDEILKEPDEKFVHSCGEIPEKKPDEPQPNSEITSEQILSLIMELSIREKQGENQDFWEKLQMAYGKNANYQETINQVKNLRQEYVRKLEKIQNNPDGGKELNMPEQIEAKKQELYQEYQQKFQKNASSVANLTNQILNNLEKNGYILAKITWTSELQAPSLTAEPSVSFSLTKK